MDTSYAFMQLAMHMILKGNTVFDAAYMLQSNFFQGNKN